MTVAAVSTRRRGIGLAPFVAVSSLALLTACWFAMAIGDIGVHPFTVLQVLANRLFGATYVIDPIQEGIVWHYRLSRAVIAACAGGILALCGVVLQALLRNPLAEPYLLGISAGASTGAAAVIVLGLGSFTLGLAGGAFSGAALAFLFVAALAGRSGGGTERIILAGIAGSQLFNAATAFIITSSANAEQTRGVMFWLLGSLGGVRWADATLAVPAVVIGTALCLFRARALDAFTFGETAASTMGVDTRRVRLELFGLAALLTASVVAVVGAIGFVGLVIPHAVRLVMGGRHHRLIPATVVSGAVFLVLADILARVILPGQVLPIGVVTALFGAPVFAAMLWTTRRQ